MKSNQVKFWRVRDLRNLELVSANYVPQSLPRRMLERFDISVIEEGAVRLKYRGATYSAGPGDVVVINPGEVYRLQADHANGWKSRGFYPTARDVCDAASQSLERQLP